jgi:hypothetical protein
MHEEGISKLDLRIGVLGAENVEQISLERHERIRCSVAARLHVLLVRRHGSQVCHEAYHRRVLMDIEGPMLMMSEGEAHTNHLCIEQLAIAIPVVVERAKVADKALLGVLIRCDGADGIACDSMYTARYKYTLHFCEELVKIQPMSGLLSKSRST